MISTMQTRGRMSRWALFVCHLGGRMPISRRPELRRTIPWPADLCRAEKKAGTGFARLCPNPGTVGRNGYQAATLGGGGRTTRAQHAAGAGDGQGAACTARGNFRPRLPPIEDHRRQPFAAGITYTLTKEQRGSHRCDYPKEQYRSIRTTRPAGCSEIPSNKAATREEVRRTRAALIPERRENEAGGIFQHSAMTLAEWLTKATSRLQTA